MKSFFKKNLVIFVIIITVITAPLVVASIPFIAEVVLYVGMWTLPNPPEPQITRGEFSFTLLYEINGEERKVEDTIVCEYAGIDMNYGLGKYREWEAKLLSGNERITLWQGKTKKGNKKEVYYNFATPGYYMGEPGEASGTAYNYSDVVRRINLKDGEIDETFISDKKLMADYGIKIISWTCEEPIHNTFE